MVPSLCNKSCYQFLTPYISKKKHALRISWLSPMQPHKVRIFWEDHEILKKLPIFLKFLGNVKLDFFSNFVPFSEYLNFKMSFIQRRDLTRSMVVCDDFEMILIAFTNLIGWNAHVSLNFYIFFPNWYANFFALK